jgi:hypothetical protein
MGRHADRVQLRHQVFADAVVEHALAVERRFLGRVEGGGVVLEILDERSGLGPLIEDLGLALVNLAAAFHGISFGRWTPKTEDGTPSKEQNSERGRTAQRCEWPQSALSVGGLDRLGVPARGSDFPLSYQEVAT